MNREYHRWHSPALDRDMELLIFGHAGARVLVFPTSLGKYYEWEDRGMIGVLGEALERGWLQLYCVDSVDAESWYARRSHPGARAWRQVQYDNYLTHEVLPLMGQKNSNAFTMTAGASFGAYHAANYAFRHPDLVQRTLCFSGIYDIRQWADGYHDDNVYYNNPLEYLPNEHDPWRLARLREMDIILVTGQDDPNRASTEALSGVLWGQGIGNALRLWDGWAHDWPWWRDMLKRYINGHD